MVFYLLLEFIMILIKNKATLSVILSLVVFGANAQEPLDKKEPFKERPYHLKEGDFRKISKKEFIESAAERFDKMDKNKDGFLTQEEMPFPRKKFKPQ